MVQERVQRYEAAKQAASPYEELLAELGMPVYTGTGVRSVAALERGACERYGISGAAVLLDGMQGWAGALVLELPAGWSGPWVRHMYEEWLYVIDGNGVIELRDGADGPHREVRLETDCVFNVPLNLDHRVVNGGSDPMVVLSYNNAPFMLDLLRERDAVFENPLRFPQRYGLLEAGDDGSFSPDRNGRASYHGTVFRQASTQAAPLDEQRGTGYQYIGLDLGGGLLGAHVGVFPSGRYSKAHAHMGGAGLMCLGGEGYSLTWQPELGTRPFEAGHGEHVRRQDFDRFGLVSVGVGWFHQHFSTGEEPLRLLAFRYGASERPSVFMRAQSYGVNQDIKQGGRSIGYDDQDPEIDEIYGAAVGATVPT